MKQLITAILASAVFCLLSCGTVDMAKKYPKMVADADPVSAGSVEVEFDRMFSSKLKVEVVEVIFYPRLNAVALEFRHELVRYRQFWDDVGRLQFISALEMYKQDYAARNLNTKYRKTRSVYGRIKGHVEWETFKFTQTYVSYPNIEIGYRFRNDTPFFATLMRSAKAEKESSGGPDTMESQQMNMYFTRAQADDLVKLFDQAYLMGLLGRKGEIRPDQPVAVDEYNEYGD